MWLSFNSTQLVICTEKLNNIFKGGIGMTTQESIETLKDYRKGDFVDDYKLCEAIDTVVSHYEKSEKIEFLKSAKQPSEITYPYDLSKK